MSITRTLAVAARVLRQLRRDPRTIALLVALPSALMALLAWMFADRPGRFDQVAPALVAIFPFTVMFLVTSVTTLREREGGTLERLLALPMGRLDFLLGYAVAFGVVSVVQTLTAVSVCVGLLGLHVSGSLGLLVVIAAADAILGSALGLFVSAFARSEFQAVQFMPAVVVPQLLLCGLFVPRSDLPGPLERLSDVLPLSYAVHGLQQLSAGGSDGSVIARDVTVVVLFGVGALALGAATLRRQSP